MINNITKNNKFIVSNKRSSYHLHKTPHFNIDEKANYHSTLISQTTEEQMLNNQNRLTIFEKQKKGQKHYDLMIKCD